MHEVCSSKAEMYPTLSQMGPLLLYVYQHFEFIYDRFDLLLDIYLYYMLLVSKATLKFKDAQLKPDGQVTSFRWTCV